MNDSQVVGPPTLINFPSRPLAKPSAPGVCLDDEEPVHDQLVQRCLEGDEHAWEEVLIRYRGLVYNIASRFGATRDDASDILQAVCLETLNSLSQLRNVQSFRSWLITVTVRQAWRWKRKRSSEVPLDALEPEAQEFLTAAEMPHMVWENEETKLLHEGVAQLPKRNAEMMRLLFFENPPVPYDEVARRLGLARGSIGFIRGRTLAKLRKILIESGYSRQGIV
ncbi:MAG: sigma-70 family RNA polymerase sigma factor [Acidobacteriia bacterium]|nr:sigma-70 family RNA polymerase sigma factor [Terriglobia bacterium]